MGVKNEQRASDTETIYSFYRESKALTAKHDTHKKLITGGMGSKINWIFKTTGCSQVV